MQQLREALLLRSNYYLLILYLIYKKNRFLFLAVAFSLYFSFEKALESKENHDVVDLL